MTKRLSIIALMVLAIIASPAAFAAEPVPGDSCTAGEEDNFQRTGGKEIPTGHLIVCKSGTWRSILSWDAAAAITKIGNLSCTNNQILKFNGTTWGCAADNGGTLPGLNSAQIWVGDGSNAATAVTISGDATLSNAGVLTIGSNAIGSAEITNASIALADLSATGTASATTYLRGDNTWATISGGDNLGNHTAGANIQLGSYWVTRDGTAKGLSINTDGQSSFMRAAGAASTFALYGGDGTQWAALNPNSTAGAWNSLVQANDISLLYSRGTIDTGALVIGPWSASGKGLRIDATGGTTAAYLSLNATDGVNEGGELALKGAGSYATFSIDNYQGNARIHTLGTGKRFYVTGGDGVDAANFYGSGANLTNLNASNLASGTVPTARLGSGTANGSVFLRGDGTWAAAGADNLGAGGTTAGQININNTGPTITFQDTDHRTGFIHQNANLMYFLTSASNNATGWTVNGSQWPLTINMTNDELNVGGQVNLLEGPLALGAQAITSSAGTVIDGGGGWHRTYGNTGWYNGTHGGGWYMVDSTYIRNYNSKQVYLNADITAPGYNHTSDARLKKNIVTVADPVQTVMDLRGVRYEWIKSGKPAYGFIAQEVEAVIPEAVAEDSEGIKSVEYDQIIAPLLEAVKAQELRIQALETEIQLLRGTTAE